MNKDPWKRTNLISEVVIEGNHHYLQKNRLEDAETKEVKIDCIDWAHQLKLETPMAKQNWHV